MKKKVFPIPILGMLIIACITLFSCTKSSSADDPNDPNNPNNPNNPCTKLAQVHAKPFTPVTKGGEIHLTADSLAGAYYFWSGPGNYQSYNQNNVVSYSADYYHRGWYYVRVSYDGCTDRFDSVYVNVTFPQGNPSCTPANNSATFSSLGTQNFYGITFGPVTGGYGAVCNSTNGDLSITLSGYWSTHDLEDGIYYTSSDQVIDYPEIGSVFISAVNQSIYWVAEPGKPVYISHVNGKRRITFCGIQFSGSLGGPLYYTTVSAQITQP